ncbi:MAG: adenylate/guanylate cyclase domain-containing protein [Deltaproteobacteria bacterium]|nr:adenylate/guanylate cyclase domain-containing protein [Deltaproteobacteria bacterium]
MRTGELQAISWRLLQEERAKGEARLARVRMIVLWLVTLVQIGFLLPAPPSDLAVQLRAVLVFGAAALVATLWWWVYRRFGLFPGAIALSTSFDVAVAGAITLNWSIYPGGEVLPTQLKFGVGYGIFLAVLTLTAVRFDYRSVLLATAESLLFFAGLALLVASVGEVEFVAAVEDSFQPHTVNAIDLAGRFTVLVFAGGILAYGAYRVDRMLQQGVRIAHQKQMLGQFVSQRVAEALETGDAGLDLSGQRRHIAILFCDIRGFTTLSETMEPEALLALLNAYYEQAAEVVFEHQGTLDKYLGDGFMALFGAPTPLASPSRAALDCARDLLRRLETFRGPGGRRISIGVGIHSGEVVVGNLGTEAYKSYTAIGRGVNLAARIEAATREAGEDLLFSEAVRAALADDGGAPVEVIEAGTFALKGIAEPQALFTVREGPPGAPA